MNIIIKYIYIYIYIYVYNIYVKDVIKDINIFMIELRIMDQGNN